MSRTILIIGAGKTGRGFLPQYIKPDDQILFIDKDENIIQGLKTSSPYEITFYGETKQPLCIRNYKAYIASPHTYETCIAQCDMIAISIGVEHYEELAKELKPYLSLLRDKVIVTFENCLDAAIRLQTYLGDDSLMITEGSIFCTTNTAQGIHIISQDLCYLPIKDKYLNRIFFEHITPISDFYSFMERKLYTYNLLSAFFCYAGYLKGYVWLHEAATDGVIRKDAEILMQELNPVLARYFHVTKEEQDAFSKAAIDKFANPYIKDSMTRNCRNVKRKLGEQERLMKPLKMLHDEKKDVHILLKTIAAALIYDKKEETGLGIKLLNDMNMDEVLIHDIEKYYTDELQKSCNIPLQEAEFTKNKHKV